MAKNKVILEDNLGNEVLPVTDTDSVFMMDYGTKLTDKLKNFDTSLETKAKQVDLNVAIGDINNLKNSKTDKATSDSIQQQVNNLVIGSGTSSAEVVQARGIYAVLNDRLDIIDNIRKGNNATMLTNEIADILNINPNLWVNGDVTLSYTSGQTWKYKDYVVSGFEVGKTYNIGLTTVLNHVNTGYIVEVVGLGILTNMKTANTTVPFVANNTTLTLRFQTIAGVASTSNGIASYSGIYIRKSGTTVKDNAITKQYDIAELLRSSEIYDIPIFLENNATFSRTGGTAIYTNYSKTYNVNPNTKYVVSYDTLTGSQLPNGQATVVIQYKDSSNVQIGANTNLLYIGGAKSIVITTPSNCTSFTLSFMVTGSVTFPSDTTVTWSGVNVIKGESANILLKDVALPTILKSIITPLFDLLLPPKIYVAIGYPLEIYNHTICRCGNLSDYHFIWSIAKGGSAYKDKILLKPTDDMSGTTNTLTLNVYDNNHNLVKTATSTIYYIKPTVSISPITSKNILPIGDSLTDISTWRTELYTRFSTDVASGKVNFLGTIGTAPYKHEGHSGWSLDSYLTNSGEGWNGNYKIKVATTPTITSKKQYKFGAKIFEYEKTATENGSIWVYFNRISGSGFVTLTDSPCVQVDGAISGESSIAFTDMQITSMNPFYNSATSGFDSKYYSDTYLSGVIPTDVMIWLGTNGGSPNIDLASVNTSATSQILKYKTIIDNIKTNWTTAKIYLFYLHYRPNQNGQGYTNGVGSSKAWDNYVFEFNKQLFATFGAYSNVILVPVGQTFDRENNYPTTNINVNTRNIQTITVASDTVHPSQTTGFLQFADSIYGAFVNNLS